MKLLLITVTLLISGLLMAQQLDELSNTPEIGIVEKLDTAINANIELISENGDSVYLGELINKPTILALVYYRCPGVCTPLMDGLAEVVKKSDLAIGTDYQVITVSFNPREGYELAARKKRNYFNALNLEEVKDGWMFFTTDSTNIASLTNNVGFRYKKTGNDYLHTATLIFISPQGTITRYLNGTRFLPFEFKLAVLETSQGKTGPTINKVLQYCYSYDPSGQRYVLNITRVAGVIISFILVLIFVTLVLRSIKRKPVKA